jgi:uncharacterized protein (DUF427 family)
MKIPGLDHPISITPAQRRVRAAFHNHVIGDTLDAVILHEASYPKVYYFPKEDVEMAFLGQTEHRSYCPYKGDASYWTINMDGELAENAVWAYEDPYPSVYPIRGRVAFYADRVDVYEVDAAEVVD